jgi:rod shape-determining protein MreC
MRNTRRSRLVLTILLLAAFSLITLDYRTGALESVRRVAGDVFGPIEDGVSDVTHPIGSWFSGIGHIGSYKSENAALKRRISELEGQLRLTQAQRVELAQDQKLLHLAGLAQFTIVSARVTAYGGSLGFEETATINRGSANGVRVNQTVITGDGLVGRTIHVSRSTATILLGDDPTFIAGARVEGKQLEIGTVQGGGVNREMSLTVLNNTAPLTAGQQLVTFGSDKNLPFVPEVPIGTITHVNPLGGGASETALVKPFVDFTAVNVVGVVVKAPPSVKHDLLLPKSPTPAPTLTVTVTATPGTSSSASPGATTTSTP